MKQIILKCSSGRGKSGWGKESQLSDREHHLFRCGETYNTVNEISVLSRENMKLQSTESRVVNGAYF